MTIRLSTTVFAALVLFVCLPGSARPVKTGKITGQVISIESGEPVADASVMVVGTRRGAMTDVDGWFIIDGLKSGKCTIKISHLEYEPVTIKDVVVSIHSDGSSELPSRQLKEPRRSGTRKYIILSDDDFQETRAAAIQSTWDQATGVVTIRDGVSYRTGVRAFEVAHTVNEKIPRPQIGLKGVEPEKKIYNGSIEGTITDAETGKAVKGVSVILIGAERTVTTDSGGKFLFKKLPIGRYEILLSVKDYLTVSITDIAVFRHTRTSLRGVLERNSEG